MVAYIRVSTDKQSVSGLGLEAQERAVAAHVGSHGCILLATYTEIETGKRDTLANRPELRKAIAHARRSKAVLVVAKLDRLTRSVAVLSLLQTSGIEFVACDNPYANRLTVQILAAVAENEVRAISQRTREGLESYKRRGGVLGSARPECAKNLSDEARAKGVVAAALSNRAKKAAAYEDLIPVVGQLREDRLSYDAIAAALNTDGHTTRRGKPFSAMQVYRIAQLDR